MKLLRFSQRRSHPAALFEWSHFSLVNTHSCLFRSEIVSKCQSAVADAKTWYSRCWFRCIPIPSTVEFLFRIVLLFIKSASLMFSFNLLVYELPFDDVTHVLLFFVVDMIKMTAKQKPNSSIFIWKQKKSRCSVRWRGICYRLHQTCNIFSRNFLESEVFDMKCTLDSSFLWRWACTRKKRFPGMHKRTQKKACTPMVDPP